MTVKCHLNNYHQYLDQLSRDQLRVLRANPSLANRIVNASLNVGYGFRCVKCGKLRLDLTLGVVRRTCSDQCLKAAKGHFAGKKRPEHSSHMKLVTKRLIAEGKFWNEQHRANNRKHLEALNSSLTTEQRSLAKSTDQSRRRQLMRFVTKDSSLRRSKYFVKSSFSSLTARDLSSFSDRKISRLHTEYNSIKSNFAMDNNPNMGTNAFYKKIFISDLRFNKKRKSVTVRSSLEYSFVLWLESSGIPWVYEWANVQYQISGSTRLYSPDFKILLDGEFWVVETKGFYTENSFPKERKKMIVCAAKCRAFGYRMCLLNTGQIGKRGVSVDPSNWVDLTELSDRQIGSYINKHMNGKKHASH